MLDFRTEAEVSALTRSLLDVASGCLHGLYIHGSATLGDFCPGRSDLDVLVVVDDNADEPSITTLATRFAAHTSDAAVGIEASVVERGRAGQPQPPWAFRVHVTTAPADRKVVSGENHPGDPDLALHYLVARAAGHAAFGPPAKEVFGELDRDLVVQHLAAELRWAAAEAPTTYAVLNACRALRFVAEGLICSKTDGGRWALKQGIEPGLVATALAAHTEGDLTPGDEGRAWVNIVAEELT